MHESVYRILAWYLSYDLAGRTREWLNRDRGANAAEYALILAAVTGVIALLVFILGGRVKSLFQNTCDRMAPAGPPGAPPPPPC
jgi:Flp pilus assembly pilin Flp